MPEYYENHLSGIASAAISILNHFYIDFPKNKNMQYKENYLKGLFCQIISEPLRKLHDKLTFEPHPDGPIYKGNKKYKGVYYWPQEAYDILNDDKEKEKISKWSYEHVIPVIEICNAIHDKYIALITSPNNFGLDECVELIRQNTLIAIVSKNENRFLGRVFDSEKEIYKSNKASIDRYRNKSYDDYPFKRYLELNAYFTNENDILYKTIKYKAPVTHKLEKPINIIDLRDEREVTLKNVKYCSVNKTFTDNFPFRVDSI